MTVATAIRTRINQCTAGPTPPGRDCWPGSVSFPLSMPSVRFERRFLKNPFGRANGRRGFETATASLNSPWKTITKMITINELELFLAETVFRCDQAANTPG